MDALIITDDHINLPQPVLLLVYIYMPLLSLIIDQILKGREQIVRLTLGCPDIEASNVCKSQKQAYADSCQRAVVENNIIKLPKNRSHCSL